jgi:GrpB-like predicted nucleotidyltransferase (UPF0157 family)
LGEGYGDGVSIEERHPSLDDCFDPAVRIVDYDAAWPALAEAELPRIEETLGGITVGLSHVGSTAVPGLAGQADPRPAALRRCARISAKVRPPLERLGYLFAPAPESPDFHFFARPPERPRTHHLHVCEAGSEHEFRHVAVRDFLRAHDEEATRYAALKRRLAGRHPQDRLAYIEGKSAYVAALEGRAVSWARDCG